MAHHHHHHEEDTYFLDQLCLVALSGAFGVICLSLYFFQPRMLNLLLGQQFHVFVLASGIALAILTVLRGASLWVAAGKEQAHAHAHDHNDQDHGDGCCGHEHDHCEHGNVQEHVHVHVHDHGHGPHDHQHVHAAHHDHGWAPWRYVVLLMPVILFLLGLPNRGPTVQSVRRQEDLGQMLAREAADSAGLVAAVPFHWTGLALTGGWLAQSSFGPAILGDFKTLEEAARDSFHREHWKDKTVKLLGQYAPAGGDRFFYLARFRIQCCGADAVPVTIPVMSQQPLPAYQKGQWVNVTARVGFRQRGGSYFTVLQVPGPHAVLPSEPDPMPYIQ